MNRRQFIGGVAAVAVAAGLPVVQGQGFTESPLQVSLSGVIVDSAWDIAAERWFVVLTDGKVYAADAVVNKSEIPLAAARLRQRYEDYRNTGRIVG